MKAVREIKVANIRKAFEAGVQIAMGTDPRKPVPLWPACARVEIYVEMRMTRQQALETATVHGGGSPRAA
ncbi:hypothetical protein [Roseicyclus sp.]|uniref:hypothetical protein n=1 Tax=Roseicyclus sp. TaxID=1914329 RepID=UPI001BCD8048|nr:hypothetical protein [Roseicyclus sp.]